MFLRSPRGEIITTLPEVVGAPSCLFSVIGSRSGIDVSSRTSAVASSVSAAVFEVGMGSRAGIDKSSS